MPTHLLVYIGIVAAVALLPGPDTAVVTKNALLHGRPAAMGSAIGVNVGLFVWTLATALGVASLLRASSTAYDTIKLLGAVYLVWLGAKALWDSRHPAPEEPVPAEGRRPLGGVAGLRQGVVSNLANPKIAIFFTSLLPQFVSRHSPAFPQLLLLGIVFIAVNLVWMSSYAFTAARMATALSRPRVKAALDRGMGAVLIGVGIWLATDRN